MFPTCEFGTFIDDDRAYRITTPFPPRPLTNVLHSAEGYLSELTHWGTGAASIEFPDGETNTVVQDENKTLFCRDEDSGEVWCPGVAPMISTVTDFSCEVHETWSLISSVHDGIQVSWRIFVPEHGYREIWTVSLKNMSRRPRRISLVPAVALSLTGFPTVRFFGGQGHYSTCEWRDDVGALYFHAGNPQAGWPRYNAALASSRPVKSYCGDALTFLGPTMKFHYPQVLLKNSSLGDKIGFQSETPFASIQTVVKLAPAATEITDLMLAVIESPAEATRLVKELHSRRRVEKLGDGARDAVRRRRENLLICTPDRKINAFVNTWMRKGLEYCICKKDATRDNLQFADGLVMSDPKRVRAELLRILRWQHADGHTLRSWVPLDRTEYGDGPMWIVLTVCGYLKFSDDLDFLDVKVPFFDKGEATVRERLELCIRRLDEDRGPHGIPRIHFADWNDALNLKDPDAESVFVAMGFGFCLKEMAELMRYLGANRKADEYERKHAALRKLVNKVAWDDAGGYYVRGFADGKIVGGSRSAGSKIFINPQSWSILGEIVTRERLPRVLKTLEEKMEMKVGIPINIPPFEKYDPRIGRITAQLPWTGENGGVYCHATSFKTAADVKIGRGDAALRCLHKIMPDSKENPVVRSGGTPYSLTSSYTAHPRLWGKAGRPWLTGTQGWVMRTVVEGLIGVRRDYGGFTIAPALPSGWKSASMVLKRNAAEYRFEVRRRAGKPKTVSVTLDGKKLSGNFLPFQRTGVHRILVAV